jgi:GT2 family glycosyltransferase
MNEPIVSIVMINYNSIDLTFQSLRSIQNVCAPGSYEVIIVDNASIDGSSAAIASNFPWVKLIQNESNIGFGRANNIGAEASIGKYIFLLNTDTWLINDAPRILAKYLEKNPLVFVCGPQQLKEDMQPQVVGGSLPSLSNLLWDHLHLWSLFSNSISWHFQVLGPHYEEQPKKYEYLMGSALMIPRKIWNQIGGFDPDFFFYYEESELCFRIKKLGGEIHLVSDAQIVHLHGGSTGGRIGRETYESFLKLRTSERLFFQKTKGHAYWNIYRLFAMSLYWIKGKITGNPVIWNNYLAYKNVPK